MGVTSSHLNPNSWRILLYICLVISAELGVEIGMLELKNMYIKKNDVDDGRVYILVHSTYGLVPKLPEYISGLKGRLFYVSQNLRYEQNLEILDIC